MYPNFPWQEGKQHASVLCNANDNYQRHEQTNCAAVVHIPVCPAEVQEVCDRPGHFGQTVRLSQTVERGLQPG